MKLNDKILRNIYIQAFVEQYENELVDSGFSVMKDYKIDNNHIVDLYAKKGDKKKIYEFRTRDHKENASVEGSLFKSLNTIAKNIGAELYFVMVEIPQEKHITFDALNEIIEDYIFNDELPSAIDELSTHSSIDEVYIDDISDIEITNDEIIVSGEGSITVNLQYGSDVDVDNDIGLETFDSFPFTFTATLTREFILDKELDYDIDTSSFYK